MSRFGLAGQYGRWASASAAPPVGVVIPMNSIIMYDGSDPGLSNWSRYTTADTYYVKGTATQGSIGTTSTASASGTVTVTLTTNGSHTGTTNISYATGPFGGSTLVGQNNTAGSHTHSFSSSSISNSLRPYNTAVTLLRATSDQTTFPANTIHISPTNAGGWTQRVATTANRYILGGNGVTNGNQVTATISGTSTTSGTHSHTSNARGTGGQSNPPQGFYKLGASQGSHTHTASVPLSITAINAKLLKLWNTAATSIVTTDLVLMFVGTLSALPTGWYLCDGSNGTINMTSYFLGYSSSAGTAWDTTTTTTGSAGAGTISTNSWSHYHYSSDSAGQSYIESFAHNTLSASHTHGTSVNLSGFSYSPPTINVAFIQYKG